MNEQQQTQTNMQKKNNTKVNYTHLKDDVL